MSSITDERAVEQHLLGANFDRRNLSTLSMLRIAMAQYPLADGEPKMAYYQKMAGLVGFSKKEGQRQVTRLISLLALPVPLQQAYDNGLSYSQCQQLIALGAEQCNRLAQQALAGEDWLSAAKQLLSAGSPKPATTRKKTAADHANDSVEKDLVNWLAQASKLRTKFQKHRERLSSGLPRKPVIAAQQLLQSIAKAIGMPSLRRLSRKAEENRKAEEQREASGE